MRVVGAEAQRLEFGIRLNDLQPDVALFSHVSRCFLLLLQMLELIPSHRCPFPTVWLTHG